MLKCCKDLDISKNILIFASLKKKETTMGHFDISAIVSDYCTKHELEYVNTTDGQNGYPSCVKVGICAFANSKQLTDVQAELQSIFGNKADVVIEIPAVSPKSDVQGAVRSIQPMGSLFEQSEGIYMDIVIMMLMEKLGLDSDTMFGRHANME